MASEYPDGEEEDVPPAIAELSQASAPTSLRGIRACKRCGILKTLDQFLNEGCENCPFLDIVRYLVFVCVLSWLCNGPNSTYIRMTWSLSLIIIFHSIFSTGRQSRTRQQLYECLLRRTGCHYGPTRIVGGQVDPCGQLPSRCVCHCRHGTIRSWHWRRFGK